MKDKAALGLFGEKPVFLAQKKHSVVFAMPQRLLMLLSMGMAASFSLDSPDPICLENGAKLEFTQGTGPVVVNAILKALGNAVKSRSCDMVKPAKVAGYCHYVGDQLTANFPINTDPDELSRISVLLIEACREAAADEQMWRSILASALGTILIASVVALCFFLKEDKPASEPGAHSLRTGSYGAINNNSDANPEHAAHVVNETTHLLRA